LSAHPIQAPQGQTYKMLTKDRMWFVKHMNTLLTGNPHCQTLSSGFTHKITSPSPLGLSQLHTERVPLKPTISTIWVAQTCGTEKHLVGVQEPFMVHYSKHCRDHRRLCPNQALCIGFSTARLSGGRLSHLGKQVGCSHSSPNSVWRVTLYVYLSFLTFQTLPFW
jgi:hypothetical protein